MVRTIVVIGDVLMHVVADCPMSRRRPVEVRVAENRVGGCQAAAGMAVDAEPLQIHVRVSRAELLDRRDVVRQTVVAMLPQ